MPDDPRVGVIREIFRHIDAWRALYEIYGTDTLPTDHGTWTLWEIEYLIEEGVPLLSRNQQQAITLYLLDGLLETQAAEIMGVPGSPIGRDATNGIKRLLSMMDAGELPKMRHESEGAA